MTARRALEPDEDGTDRRGRGRGWIAVLVSLVVILGGAGVGWVFARDAVRGWFEVADYPGPGGDEVVVTIPKGASLTRIGELLTEADVVASATAFVKAAGEVPGAATIQAGTFRLRSQIPARTAVEMLLDPANVQRNTFVLREGGWLADHVDAMAAASGLPASSFEELLEAPEPLGLRPAGKLLDEGDGVGVAVVPVPRQVDRLIAKPFRRQRLRAANAAVGVAADRLRQGGRHRRLQGHRAEPRRNSAGNRRDRIGRLRAATRDPDAAQDRQHSERPSLSHDRRLPLLLDRARP